MMKAKCCEDTQQHFWTLESVWKPNLGANGMNAYA